MSLIHVTVVVSGLVGMVYGADNRSLTLVVPTRGSNHHQAEFRWTARDESGNVTFPSERLGGTYVDLSPASKSASLDRKRPSQNCPQNLAEGSPRSKSEESEIDWTVDMSCLRKNATVAQRVLKGGLSEGVLSRFRLEDRNLKIRTLSIADVPGESEMAGMRFYSPSLKKVLAHQVVADNMTIEFDVEVEPGTPLSFTAHDLERGGEVWRALPDTSSGATTVYFVNPSIVSACTKNDPLCLGLTVKHFHHFYYLSGNGTDPDLPLLSQDGSVDHPAANAFPFFLAPASFTTRGGPHRPICMMSSFTAEP